MLDIDFISIILQHLNDYVRRLPYRTTGNRVLECACSMRPRIKSVQNNQHSQCMCGGENYPAPSFFFLPVVGCVSEHTFFLHYVLQRCLVLRGSSVFESTSPSLNPGPTIPWWQPSVLRVALAITTAYSLWVVSRGWLWPRDTQPKRIVIRVGFDDLPTSNAGEEERWGVGEEVGGGGGKQRAVSDFGKREL